jgi:chromosomal replication initiation ATPase DnaA
MIQIHLALQEYMRSGKKYSPPVKIKLSIERIAQSVAEYHGVTVEHMKEVSRRRSIVLPRQQATYAMRVKGYTLAPIAEYFYQDHTTVINSIKSVRNSMDTDPDYRVEIDNILHNVSKLEYEQRRTN